MNSISKEDEVARSCRAFVWFGVSDAAVQQHTRASPRQRGNSCIGPFPLKQPSPALVHHSNRTAQSIRRIQVSAPPYKHAVGAHERGQADCGEELLCVFISSACLLCTLCTVQQKRVHVLITLLACAGTALPVIARGVRADAALLAAPRRMQLRCARFAVQTCGGASSFAAPAHQLNCSPSLRTTNTSNCTNRPPPRRAPRRRRARRPHAARRRVRARSWPPPPPAMTVAAR